MPVPISTAKALGQNIRKARLAAGLTQEALAHAIGYRSKGSPGQICKVETGYQEPSLQKLSKIAVVLKVPIPELIRARTYVSFVKREREAAGMTQLQLAHALGMKGEDAGAYISRIEKGGHQPRLSTLRRIAEVLGVTLDRLILGEQTVVKGKGKK